MDVSSLTKIARNKGGYFNKDVQLEAIRSLAAHLNIPEAVETLNILAENKGGYNSDRVQMEAIKSLSGRKD